MTGSTATITGECSSSTAISARSGVAVNATGITRIADDSGVVIVSFIGVVIRVEIVVVVVVVVVSSSITVVVAVPINMNGSVAMIVRNGAAVGGVTACFKIVVGYTAVQHTLVIHVIPTTILIIATEAAMKAIVDGIVTVSIAAVAASTRSGGGGGRSTILFIVVTRSQQPKWALCSAWRWCRFKRIAVHACVSE